MKKCEKCGKEVLFPFTCTYCGNDYCDEHRLPESHECSNLPKEAEYWYQKRTVAEESNKNRNMESEGNLHFIRKGARTEPKSFSKRETSKTTHIHFSVWRFVCILAMFGVTYAFIPSLDWALSFPPSEPPILSYLPMAFVLAMSHELLHALAWWYFGYFAIPIPILIPPFLGITIGSKPRRRYENMIVSLAPILLTVVGFLATKMTGNTQYSVYGVINLFGMGYDMFSALTRK
jgi:hypothetical protein